MPYLIKEARESIDTGSSPRSAGELNYAITMLLKHYWDIHPQNYQTINDISGACTEALAEFRRRIVGNYEDQKIAENGDVYP